MKITDFLNNTFETKCLSCDVWQGKITAPFGVFAESKYFYANQDIEVPIPGFIIICSKKHVHDLDDFSDEERLDFIDFLVRMRKGLRKLGIEQVKFIQNENSEHHFHIWILPILEGQKKKFGVGIASVKPVTEYAKANMNTLENLKKIEEYVLQLKECLAKN